MVATQERPVPTVPDQTKGGQSFSDGTAEKCEERVLHRLSNILIHLVPTYACTELLAPHGQ